MLKLKHAALAAAVMSAGLPAAANAATLIINVGGAQSVGAIGTAGNTTASYLLGANAHITSVSYNVSITAFSPSWLSEATFLFANTANTGGVNLTPGIGDDISGTRTYTGSGDLVSLGLDFFLGADGLLKTEFFEAFNDSGVSPDAVWNSGTITITYAAANSAVPEPTTWAMLIVGFGAIGAAARGRRKLTVRYAA